MNDMTDDEKDRALCEAHCNSAADEYFNPRPQLDSAINRRIFYAGHRKAWLQQAEATAPLLARIAELEKALAECRDAYPAPEAGSALESLWVQAMGDPESVGAYVKARALSAAPAAQPSDAQDAARYRWLRQHNSHYLYNQAWLSGLTVHKDGPCDIFSADEVPALLDAEIDKRMGLAVHTAAAPAAQPPDAQEALRVLHCIETSVEEGIQVTDGWRILRNLISAAPAAQPDKVLVDLDVLEAAADSLGCFCSDEGWGDKDMQNLDNVLAFIARHKAKHGIKEQP